MSTASLAEVTASVKRSVESLRTAEALATYASVVNPSFMSSRAASTDSAFANIGLYSEHNFIDPNHLSEALRAAFQRRVATQISNYVNTLQSDASAVLGSSILHNSGTTRFFVFNALGHTRTDVADIATALSSPFRVVDVTSGQEVRSQLITKEAQQYIRILAEHVPSVGYRVYEIQQIASQFTDSAVTFSNGNSTFENDKYTVTIDGRGAITSLIDKRDANRELVQNIGGLAMNDIGSGSGSPVVENVGPVSATIRVNSTGSPSHTTRITLYKTIDRVDIENEVTQNFGSGEQTYSFGFNMSGYTVRHEEVGAIATAKLQSQGGSYSNDLSRFDFFTMNHFVDISDFQRGVTLSNWDSPFFRLGNSSGSSIDVTTPQVKALIGVQPDGHGFVGQNGDSYFKNRSGMESTIRLAQCVWHSSIRIRSRPDTSPAAVALFR
ncbi:MAG: hypothetical protein HW374_1312 [Bacteroidetes bacterium]|nr:hypothetical protein [Bacteroidota bacterium]